MRFIDEDGDIHGDGRDGDAFVVWKSGLKMALEFPESTIWAHYFLTAEQAVEKYPNSKYWAARLAEAAKR